MKQVKWNKKRKWANTYRKGTATYKDMAAIASYHGMGLLTVHTNIDADEFLKNPYC